MASGQILFEGAMGKAVDAGQSFHKQAGAHLHDLDDLIRPVKTPVRVQLA